MTTARRALPVLAVLAVTALVVVMTRGSEAPRAAPSTTTSPDPVEVDSDAPRFESVAAMVDASDLVVVGEVTATERGRLFGDPDSDAAITSRLVTLRVDETLVGGAPGRRLLVEEEGWTLDGAPLVVDGLRGSRVGDRGVWFLIESGSEEPATWLVVGPQGRSVAAAGVDVEALAAEVRALT